MKKRMIALILLAVLALSLPALGEPLLKLVPVQWCDEDREYTMHQNKCPVTVTQEWLDAQGVTLEQLQGGVGIGLASETFTQPMPGEMLLKARVVSVLPDGETLLLEMDGVPMLFDGENIRVVSIDLTRCKPSEDSGYRMLMGLHGAIRTTGIGCAGYIWSPDGRVALVANGIATLGGGSNPFGMTLLDARDGALYMAEPGGSYNRGMGMVIQQACFDDESGLLYCVVYVNRTSQLRSYNPESGRWKILSSPRGAMACEGMGWNAQGKLQFLMYDGGDIYLTTHSLETGMTAQELLPNIGNPMNFAVTPSFTLLVSKIKSGDMEFSVPYCFADGGIYRIAFFAEDGATRAQLEPAEDAPQSGAAVKTLSGWHAALSPDGRYALLACMSREWAFSAYVMDTSTLALTSVDISAFADEIAEKGAGFQYGNGRWRPGLCFTGGDRYILLPFLDGSTVLCELTETGAQ